jgi:ABC-type molybdenum transport system ATPase subunit/photorepair protein PhrA
MNSKTLLSIKNLKLRFNEEKSVMIRELEIKQGDFITIYGKNGVGKSTFLDLLAGEDLDQLGTRRIKIEGKAELSINDKVIDLVKLNNENNNLKIIEKNRQEINLEVSYLNQNQSYESNNSVYAVLTSLVYNKYPKRSSDINKKINRQKFFFINLIFKEILKETKELSNYSKIFRIKRLSINKLSFGEQKIISFMSRAFYASVFKPSLLILDEPLNFLSPESKKLLNNILIKIFLKDQLVKTTALILVSHCNIFPFILNNITKQLVFEVPEVTVKVEDKLFIKCLGEFDEENLVYNK